MPASKSSRIAKTLCLGLALAACSPGAPPRSVLIITLDTLRADAVGTYGQSYPITPSLDRLASRGIVFEHAMTSVPLTLPAHASAMTGLYPPRHTVRVNGQKPLPESAVTLAERAREAGCQTAAFLGASVLDAGFGLAQGFDTYSSPSLSSNALPEAGHHGGQRPGTEVVSEAIAWLEERDPERPFLLWVHLFDAHDPYDPPEPFRPRADIHPYYGDVAMADACVGGLLAWLDENRLLEQITVLAVGDHGEALGQHGETTHGDYVYESTMHIPMILTGPGIPAGERRQDLVSIVDVAPTLGEILGFGWRGETDGRSLLAPPDPLRGVYFECYTGFASYGWSPLAGWRDAEGKYLHSSKPRFFRLAEDPLEERDLLANGEIETASYERSIRELFERPRLPADPDNRTVDPNLAESVQALGYATATVETSSFPNPLEETKLPAPFEREEQHTRALEANELLAQERFAEAAALLEPIVADSPTHWTAWDLLALARFSQDDFVGALQALDVLLAGRPNLPTAHLYRGRSLWELGDREAGLVAMQTAARLSPNSTDFLHPYAAALEKLGRNGEAQQVGARIRELESMSR